MTLKVYIGKTPVEKIFLGASQLPKMTLGDLEFLPKPNSPDSNVIALFSGGKQGVWYDPSDKTNLFQDVAGTVPVTKDGDPVALMRDKSGNGNHAVQTVSTSRPVYKTDGILHWLAFDGVDDGFVLNFKTSVKPENSIYMSVNAEKFGSYPFLLTQNTTYGKVDWLLKPSQNLLTITQLSTSTDAAFAFGSANVVSVDSASAITVRNNGVQTATAPTTKTSITELFIGSQLGTRNYAKFKLYGTLVFEGGVYNSDADAYLTIKSGVTL